MAGAIVAMGGGGFSMAPQPNGTTAPSAGLDRFILSLARRAEPRVCFVPTAGGDPDPYIARFYRAFSRLPCRPGDLPLFERTVGDLAGFLAEQDVVYVGGGSTANLLAVWRVHGLDAALPEALAAGTVLCGISAGMNCWFEASVTDSFDLGQLAPLRDGLGLVAGSACPHYDGEPARRPTFRRLVATGELPAGYAADDGAAVVFRDGAFVEAVAERPGARAYRVSAAAGEAVEEPLTTRFVG